MSKLKVPTQYDITSLNTEGSKLYRTLKICFSVFKGNSKRYDVFTRDLLIAFVFSLLRKNVIWEAHQGTSKTARIMLKLLSLFKNFKVLTISEALKLADEIPIPKKRIYSYHDGCELSINRVETQVLTFDKKTALYTGALHKGEDVDSLSPLFNSFPDWDFIFIGGKEAEVKIYSNRYSSFKNVKFLGRMPHSDVLNYQFSADVLLFPLTKTNKLWKYTSPLKLFEYMKAGKPIVGSNIGSVSEILDQSNGFVFNERLDLVNAFNSYCKASDEDIKHMIEKNKSLIENRYNWASRAKFIIEKMFDDR
ncbi:glycosyltransferase [Pseudoalteromonas sp. ESRF-bin5]|uniref:glycosyltransferase n=1 Tax=Pseudoalteromonas sp. ESRF-bin5 TaxID=2014532 RepID=UPI00257B52B3|nr:glycosyltransferase [Pseudoalteromonas sp. ESRF-bin5]